MSANQEKIGEKIVLKVSRTRRDDFGKEIIKQPLSECRVACVVCSCEAQFSGGITGQMC